MGLRCFIKRARAGRRRRQLTLTVLQHRYTSSPPLIRQSLTSKQLEALKDGLGRNPEYAQYIQRLVSAGYFKGELEGSQLWITLESQAASAFVAARKDECVSSFLLIVRPLTSSQ